MSAAITILGHTGSNAELRYSEKGTPFTSFSIASNSTKKTQGETVQITQWFNVTAFGKTAEVLAAHVKKGMRLLVLGTLTFKPWVTNNNEPRAGAEVILNSFEFAGANRSGDTQAGNEVVDPEPSYTGPVDAPPSTNGSVPVAETAAVKEPFSGQF